MIVGGGKMGEALAAGLISAGWADPAGITVVEPIEERREELEKAYPGLRVITSPEKANDVLVSVKPNQIQNVCELLSVASPERLISIAAGVTITTLENSLPPEISVIRVMPNTPAMVNEGMSVLSPGTHASTADIEWAVSIFAAVGETAVLEEKLMNAVTGVSGSGPAYVFALAEALVRAGINEGLDYENADLLVRQTLLGAATLLSQSGESPTELREAVTSPNGTTAAAISIFERTGFQEILIDAVSAATQRAEELGS